MTDVELSTSFAPWSRRHRRALLVTPGFGFHSWIAPSVLTLPARVFDTYIDVSWRSRLTERFGVNLGVTPGLYGDFNSFGSSVFQVTGWGLGEITITPKLTLLGGVAVVRQLKSHVLPVGGLVWTPTESLRVEALIPRPRIAYRYFGDHSRGAWGYVAGQFGGGSWAITLPDGSSTLLTYSDLRLLIGTEWFASDRLTGSVEVGYVFARNLSAFEAPQFAPSDTIMLRASVTF